MIRKMTVVLALILVLPSMASASLGDLDGNGSVGLEDAILCLKLMTKTPSSVPAFDDIDGDGKIGLAEAIYILQITAKLRNDEGIPGAARIISLTNELLAEIESGLSPEDQALFNGIIERVTSFPYDRRVSLEIPESSVTTINPSTPADFYNMYSISAFLQGSMKGALWASLRAIRENPSNGQILSQIGNVLNVQGRYGKALPFLQRAKYLNSKDETVRINLAVSYLGLNRKSEAFREAAAAVATNQESNLVRERLAALFMDESARNFRKEFHSSCGQDIATALSLSNQAEVNGYLISKRDELTRLTGDLLELMLELYDLTDPSKMPSDALMSYINHPAHGDFEKANTDTDKRYEDILDEIIEDLRRRIEPLVIQAGNCVQANPLAGCQCLRAYAAGVSFEVDKSVPLADRATKSYLLEKLKSHISKETRFQELIHESIAQVSEAQWAYRYLYKSLRMDCVRSALGVAEGMQHRISYEDEAERSKDLADFTCDAIAESLESYRRWKAEKEAERIAHQRLLEELRREYQESLNLNLKGEVCLGPVICLGIDGSNFSIKVGSGAFAKFTADLEKFDVSVRVGVELGVGPLAGGDISVGGRVTSSGTSFTVEASESRFFGMKGNTVELWGARRGRID